MIALILIVFLIAGGGGGVAPQVSVAGVDMGGDQAEVTRALEQRGGSLARQLVTLRVDGGVIGAMRPSDFGARPRIADAIRGAEDASPGRLSRGWRALTGGDDITAPLPASYRDGALTAWVADIAVQVDRPEQNARVRVRGNEISVQDSSDGRALDRQALTALMTRDLSAIPADLELPIHATTPRLTTAVAQREVQQARDILARPATVSVDDVVATLPTETLGQAMRFTTDGVRIAPQDLRLPLAKAYPRHSIIPSPARFDIRGKRAVLVPSREGHLVDARAVAGGLLGEDRPVEASFTTITPVFTTDKAKGLGIQSEVGSFTTPYSPGEPRVTNIRQASRILNGTIIPAGGRLSLNQVLGQRTEEHGFVLAPMLADGLHVDAVGGGISQVATTLYNAAFFSGLTLEEHTAHQLYIDRYPMGREATVSWPTPDLVITNDWDAAALVRVWNSSDSITIALYSTSFDRRVETETSAERNPTKPATRRIETPGIAPGKESEAASGGTGFSVDVTRRVYQGSRLKNDETFTTVYLAPPKIIAVAPGTPGAEPAPRPEG